jgi:hypothetical protein
MFALDEDSTAYYRCLPELLDEVGTTVILPSIAIPLYGTPLYRQVVAEGRLTDMDLSHYEGDHLLFRHKHLSAGEIYDAYREVTLGFYSWKNIVRRWMRFVRLQSVQESLPGFVLKVLIATGVYFKLSVFQRHHGLIRIKQTSAEEEQSIRRVA